MAKVNEEPATDGARKLRQPEPRSTADLARGAAAEMDFEADAPSDEAPAWIAIRELRRRGGREELEAARSLCASDNAVAREAGVHILGCFDWERRAHSGDSQDWRRFQAECVTTLIERLSDPLDSVVAKAGCSLGHWEDSRAIPHLVKLKTYPNHRVRFGVLMGLKGLEDEAAVRALIELTRDEDAANRDWATFNLGQQIALDTPAIREALWARLNDADAATRGEAMVGLAERKDARALDAIKRELAGEFHGSWAMEAAEALADPALLPWLSDLRARLAAEKGESYFLRVCDDALAACQTAPAGVPSSADA